MTIYRIFFILNFHFVFLLLVFVVFRGAENDRGRLHARDDKKVATEVFLFQKKKENIDKTLKEKENGCRNQIRIRDSVMQGENISIPHIRCTHQEPFS